MTEQQINPMVHWGLVDADAEMAVLSTMLRGNANDALAISDKLDPQTFYNGARRLVFAAACNVLKQDHVVGRNAVVGEALRLREIFSIDATREQIENDVVNKLPAEPVNPLDQANLVYRSWWCRSLAQFTLDTQKRLQLNPDVHELYTWGQSEWQKMSPIVDSDGWVYAWDVVEQHMQMLHADAIKYDQGESDVFDFPWDAWNRRILPMEGGLVGLLVAPDGVGKSTMLAQIAEHWATKKHVVLVHLEDNKRKKWNRRLTRYSNVDYRKIRRGVHMDETTDRSIRLNRGVFNDEEIDGIIQAQRYLRESGIGKRLHYLHAPGASVRDVMRQLESRIDEGVCDAVVIDYMNKFRADAQQARLYGSNKYDRQTDDMNQVKDFAEQHTIPVFTAGQGNKSIINAVEMSREQSMGAGGVFHVAQLVVMMRREKLESDMYDEGSGKLIAEKGDDSPIVEQRVDKQNDGEKSEFELWLDGPRFMFSDMDYTRTDLNNY